MAFGLTSTGFNIKRLSDIRVDLYERLRQIEDPDTGEMLDLPNENDPVAQITDIFAEALADTWSQLGQIATAYDPNAATGAILSNQVQINGLQRLENQRSIVTLRVGNTSNADIDVPEDSIVTDTTGNLRFLVNDGLAFTIDPQSTSFFEAVSVDPGPIEANAGVLTRLEIPLDDDLTIINPTDAVPGYFVEADQDLRARRVAATANPGQSTTDSIVSALEEIPGIREVAVYVNNTLEEDDRGLPPKSIAVFAAEGNRNQIARTLFERVPTGIEYYGQERSDAFTSVRRQTVIILDNQNQQHRIVINRPVRTRMQLNISLRVTNDELFTQDSPNLIRQAIMDYTSRFVSGGGPAVTGVPAPPFEPEGWRIGRDIVVQRLLTPINSVPGHAVESLTLQRMGEDAERNDLDDGVFTFGVISVPFFERPIIEDPTFITITQVT